MGTEMYKPIPCFLGTHSHTNKMLQMAKDTTMCQNQSEAVWEPRGEAGCLSG